MVPWGVGGTEDQNLGAVFADLVVLHGPKSKKSGHVRAIGCNRAVNITDYRPKLYEIDRNYLLYAEVVVPV